MKQLIGLFLLLIFAVTPFSASGATGNGEPTRYWIRFKDKPSSQAPIDVSERTVQRRANRGTDVSALDDQPVSPVYVARLSRMGIRKVVESRWLNAISARLTPEQIQSIRDLPFVAEVRPVAMMKTTRQASGPEVARIAVNQGRLQLSSMNALAPLERGINDTGVRIGFLDTEFGGFKHPAFARLVREGRLVAYKNFTGRSQADRHGLSTASVAVGYQEGILVGPAYGAELVAATTEVSGSESHQEEDNFIAGLEWLESMGVDVVNASLGYTHFDKGGSYTYKDLTGDVAPTSIAVDKAVKHGMVVVVSAGNDGDCESPEDGCWYYVGTPADADSVIAVGAINPDSTRAPFSAHGPTADGQIKPDVVALGSFQFLDGHPAGLIAATEERNGYMYAAGTSFSGPLVAAVAAQMLQANPNLKPMEVRDILRATASKANAPDNHIGWGIVDADAAVREAERRAHLNPQQPASATVSTEKDVPADHQVATPEAG